MGNTLAEVDSALHIGEEILPLALTVLAGFDPPAAGIASVIGGFFNSAVKAVDAAAKDQSAGKDLEGVIGDVIAVLENGLNLPAGALASTPASSDPSAAGAPGT